MALETSTYINGLVATNPTASDPVSEGDDHIRLLKSTIKATFPNVTGATTATHTEMSLLTTATDANTASQLVKRDSSGNFSAGTITATTLAGTLSTAAQTNVTSVGALDGGSITSNFGAIDNGSSNITTTGDLEAGKVTIDSVVIDGSNIGFSSDTDLINLASGTATVNGVLDVTGNITTSGTVDGVDVADLNTKLTSGTVADSRIANILDKVYPVGSIYTSTTKNSTPADIFGGTWVAVGEGRVLIGAGTYDDGTDSKTFTVGASQTGKYNHTLTTSQIPSHRHASNLRIEGASNVTVDSSLVTSVASGRELDELSDHGTGSTDTGNTGGGSAHNNIQPYLTVYMWERTE
ncbi:MAG: putative baseplate wedge protein [Prokaryotic dsDNA virus sp.]|nr:MAG: putative baseplate wedge protein [Prokaryotic dsDNA virus sp.]